MQAIEKMEGFAYMFRMYVGLMAMCESYTLLADVNKELKTFALKQEEQVLLFYKRVAEIFPITKSGYIYHNALYFLNKGKTSYAINEWKDALHCSEHSDTPFEQALSLYALGKHDQNQMSISYLDQSMKMFKKMGAIHQLERVKSRKREDHKFGGSLTFDKNRWNVKKTATEVGKEKQ